MKTAGGRGADGDRKRMTSRAASKKLKAISLGVLLLALCGTQPGARGELSEYDAKAAFLFHFAQFVEWPAEAFKDAGSPLTYCTIGEDRFHGALDESVNGRSVTGRPLRVMHLKQQEHIEGCQVLFVASGERKRLEEMLASTHGQPVLTVGESEHFAQAGGMIGFCLEEKKVRFEINLDAASSAGLKISAKLLSLAKTVIGSQKEN
jgi:YfiR/HmsC-like